MDTAESAQQFKDQGNSYFGTAKFEEAISSYASAIQANPDPSLLVVLWSNTAECHLRLARYAEASAAVENALKIDKNHAKSLIRLKKAKDNLCLSSSKNLLQKFIETESPNESFLQSFKDHINSISPSILANVFAQSITKNKQPINSQLSLTLQKISLNIGYLMILQKKNLPEALTWCDLSFSNLEDIERIGHPYALARQVFINGNSGPLLNLIKIQNKNGDIKESLKPIQQERIKIWSSPDNFSSASTDTEKVKHELRGSHKAWSSFWTESDLIETSRVSCALSLKKIVAQVSAQFPGPGKFKFKLICDDSPHKDSLQALWTKPGNMNLEEQQKSIQFFTLQMSPPKLNPIPKLPTFINKNIIPGVNSLCSGVLTRPKVSVPFVKFIKVEALKKMDTLIPYEEIQEESFTEVGTFAVSYRWIDDKSNISNFKRLLRILQQVSINANEGVFIDFCCIPKDPERRRLVLANLPEVFNQAHVIFLLKKDYFSRSWCWFEFSEWLFSSFPNQAITDRVGLASSLNEISMYLFKKPICLLDRPEISSFSGIWMRSTQTAKKEQDEVGLVARLHQQYSSTNSTGLFEILTRVVFKMESTITVSDNPSEAS